MTASLDRVPVDRITAQAREVRFWRTVLTLIAGLLFGLGWATAKLLGMSWLAGAWIFVAAREGWREARRDTARRATLRTA